MVRKQLSYKGRKLAEYIVKNSGKCKSNYYWSYKATKLALREQPDIWQSFIKDQGEDYQNWTNFYNGLSPDTFKRFLNGKAIDQQVFTIFCEVINQHCNKGSFRTEEVAACDPKLLFHKFTEEMQILRSLAYSRLLLEPDDWEGQLRLYSNALYYKNNDYESTTLLLVEPEDLFSSKPEFPHEKIFQIQLLATVRTQDEVANIPWGYAFVNTENCRSELLLDIRPYMWKGSEVILGRKKIRELELPEGYLFTVIAIQLMEQSFSSYYNGKKTVKNFGGWLKDVNLRMFREKYAELISSYSEISEKEIIYLAFTQTYFGDARIKLGITDFDIRVMEKDSQDGLPSKVFVYEAKRPEV